MKKILIVLSILLLAGCAPEGNQNEQSTPLKEQDIFNTNIKEEQVDSKTNDNEIKEEEPKNSKEDKVNNLRKQAKAFKDNEEWEKALNIYNQIIELKPKDKEASFNKGCCLEKIMKYNIKVDQKHAETFYNLGIAFAKKKEYETAIKFFDKVIELNPRDVAYESKANCLSKLDRYDEAIEIRDKIIELNPNDISYHNKGVDLLMAERYEEAIENFNKALELNPKNSKASFYLGVVQGKLYKQGLMENSGAYFPKISSIILSFFTLL
jgi:tetratricopeptide (TPR) repeat protein